ncbi:hypothetical protein C457_01840 [Haloferax prahovense DSM 18310]|uniref:Uncharacterized protein n=2 Tax=Haloferax TaxID=2251 RepID=M0HL85_HALGM|nr:hypothetical protein C457_01840 [Haloferax prahovense DSM 18310]ELZ83859.1 hypothetical protein C454_06097 [Haloferax gibbonsii ATCC 33959]
MTAGGPGGAPSEPTDAELVDSVGVEVIIAALSFASAVVFMTRSGIGVGEVVSTTAELPLITVMV